MAQTTKTETRQNIYTRVTDTIVAELEKGVRPWMKPWNAEHMAGKISRPLRFNGQPYRGVNVLTLWAVADEQDLVPGAKRPIVSSFSYQWPLTGNNLVTRLATRAQCDSNTAWLTRCRNRLLTSVS